MTIFTLILFFNGAELELDEAIAGELLTEVEGILILSKLDFFIFDSLISGVFISSLFGAPTKGKIDVDTLSLECAFDFITEGLTTCSTGDFSLDKICVSSTSGGGDLSFITGLITLKHEIYIYII